jgi:hypothetical protein
MASLAMMVSLIFLATLLAGPTALVLSYLGFTWMTVLCGIYAISLGAFWCFVAPFPISIVGALCAFLGALAMIRL